MVVGKVFVFADLNLVPVDHMLTIATNADRKPRRNIANIAKPQRMRFMA